MTDHEALKVISSRGSKLSACIERWVLRLQPYNFKVCCVTSQDNIADAAWRTLLVYTDKNCALICSCEIIKTRLKLRIGTYFKLVKFYRFEVFDFVHRSLARENNYSMREKHGNFKHRV